jgi:hypothetical protein
MSPGDQYGLLQRQALGSLADVPFYAKSMAAQYAPTFGRWILQSALDPTAEDKWAAGEFEAFYNWGMRGLEEGPDKLLDKGMQDQGWRRMVESGASLIGRPEGLSNQILWDVTWGSGDVPGYTAEAESAAKARGNITGRGIYGRLRAKAFDRILDRYRTEMLQKSPEEVVALPTYLANEVGGPWALGEEVVQERVPTYNVGMGTQPPVGGPTPFEQEEEKKSLGMTYGIGGS